MKSLVNVFLLFLAVTVFVGCSDRENPYPASDLTRIFTSLDADAELQHLVSSQLQLRQGENPLDRADWDHVYKIDDQTKSETTLFGSAFSGRIWRL